ncbi:MAG: hypothetical protein KTR31_34750 [Myxococcales bacterium]|nr:hypothetical protein [Myxococcales bacterium]
MRAALAVLLASVSAPALGSEVPCDAQALTTAIEAADDAFVVMDADGFGTQVDRMKQALRCLEDALKPKLCADIHRIEAMAAFVEGDLDQVRAPFEAARQAFPGLTLGSELAPQGHPLHTYFEEAATPDSKETASLPAPATGWIAVDGFRATAAPLGRPFVFQRFDDGGAVADTAYLLTPRDVPRYPTPRTDRPKRKLKLPLIGSGLVLGLGSAVAYGASFPARQRYDAAVTAGDESRIRANHRATNGLVIGSVGGATTGLALLVAGVL